MQTRSEISPSLWKVAVHSDLTVLITGPTGSGKTTLARKIHEHGARKSGPFVTVNLATLHEGTLESELFGHERGAFTGATHARRGRLELAQGGTVFLDEIGELSLSCQARLLEFLQTKRIFPMGGARMREVDVRIIAATNKCLEEEVKRGRFREDLFHRLRVVSVQLAGLRESAENFGEVVHTVLEEIAQNLNKRILKIDECVARYFEQYSWPGNYRELRNVLEFAVASAANEMIRKSDLPSYFVEAVRAERVGFLAGPNDVLLGTYEVALSSDFSKTLAEFEYEYLKRALWRCRGRVNRTARLIGISKTTLIRRMRAYGLVHGDALIEAESLSLPPRKVAVEAEMAL